MAKSNNVAQCKPKCNAFASTQPHGHSYNINSSQVFINTGGNATRQDDLGEDGGSQSDTASSSDCSSDIFLSPDDNDGLPPASHPTFPSAVSVAGTTFNQAPYPWTNQISKPQGVAPGTVMPNRFTTHAPHPVTGRFPQGWPVMSEQPPAYGAEGALPHEAVPMKSIQHPAAYSAFQVPLWAPLKDSGHCSSLPDLPELTRKLRISPGQGSLLRRDLIRNLSATVENESSPSAVVAVTSRNGDGNRQENISARTVGPSAKSEITERGPVRRGQPVERPERHHAPPSHSFGQ